MKIQNKVSLGNKIPMTIRAIAVINNENPKIKVLEIYDYKDDSVWCDKNSEKKALIEIKFIKYVE